MNNIEKGLEDAKAGRLTTFTSVEDMWAEINKDIAKEKKEHPIKYWSSKLWLRYVVRYWDDISWFLFRDIPHRIKYGCSNKDMWGLDYATAKWILPRLKALRILFEEWPAIPCDFYEDNLDLFLTIEEQEKIGVEKWHKTVDKIIRAFEIIVYESDGDEVLKSLDYNKEVMEEYEEGMDLFRKHYRSLCD